MMFPVKSTATATGPANGAPLLNVVTVPLGCTLRILGPTHGSATNTLPEVSTATPFGQAGAARLAITPALLPSGATLRILPSEPKGAPLATIRSPKPIPTVNG